MAVKLRKRGYSLRLFGPRPGSRPPKPKQKKEEDLDNVIVEPPRKRVKVPTGARPGSKEKIEVMRQRVLAGQELWHPRDRKWSDTA
jgi:hypothetical protein